MLETRITHAFVLNRKFEPTDTPRWMCGNMMTVSVKLNALMMPAVIRTYVNANKMLEVLKCLEIVQNPFPPQACKIEFKIEKSQRKFNDRLNCRNGYARRGRPICSVCGAIPPF